MDERANWALILIVLIALAAAGVSFYACEHNGMPEQTESYVPDTPSSDHPKPNPGETTG